MLLLFTARTRRDATGVVSYVFEGAFRELVDVVSSDDGREIPGLVDWQLWRGRDTRTVKQAVARDSVFDGMTERGENSEPDTIIDNNCKVKFVSGADFLPLGA